MTQYFTDVYDSNHDSNGIKQEKSEGRRINVEFGVRRVNSKAKDSCEQRPPPPNLLKLFSASCFRIGLMQQMAFLLMANKACGINTLNFLISEVLIE